MKNKTILLLTALATALAACSKSSNPATSAAAAASSNSLVVAPMIPNPTAGQQISITVSGGSGVYTSMTADQGTAPVRSGVTNTWTYTVPTSFNLPQVTFTAYDSAGATGVGYIAIQGTSTTTPSTSTQSCAGMYTATFNTLSGQLYVVQNTSNQIGGYVYFSQSGYYQPISGTCSYPAGATSGTISFQDVSSKQTYSATITSSGGQTVLRGSIAGNIPFQAYLSSSIAAPTTETVVCSGVYNGTFGPNQGQLTLVHNGSGTMAGSLVILGNVYAVTGTCGASVTLRNLVTNSTYTGSFSGNQMGGTYALTSGQTYTWSVSK